MYDITLIFTRHKECGNCNSSELHSIIKKVEPEVIFEELSHSLFNESYENQSLITLETNAVKEYLENNKIEHIPVDTYPLPKKYYEDLDRMYHRVTSGITHDSHNLRHLLDNQKILISYKGFDFLNSYENDTYFMEINHLIERILNTINDESLFRTRRLEQEVILRREHQIIKNIYNYSSTNSYKRALMFIGSGHRKSVLTLLKEYEIHEGIKLNWLFFDPTMITY